MEKELFKAINRSSKSLLVLDEDPKIAAKSLIKAHVIYYIKTIQRIFIAFHKKSCNSRNTPIYTWVNFISRSRQNFIWAVDFYNSLQNIYKTYISKDNNYLYDCKIPFEDSYLEMKELLPNGRREIPLNIIEVNKHFNSRIKFLEFKEKHININRIKYISKGYPDSFFINNKPPEWYRNVSKIFEYNSIIDNAYVKIERDKFGEYKYFCKIGASDLLVEIKDIKDMKYIINALLYS